MTLFFRIIILAIICFANLFPSLADEAQVLFNSSNTYGTVFVFEKNGLRCVSFNSPNDPVTQSCMLPDKPKLTLFDYPQIIVSSILLKEHARRILMIGLAGASVAKGLNTLVPNIDFDIVEINPSMPKIAHQFFAFSPPPKTKIHIEDGIQFINDTPKNSYDIIIIDAFTKDYIPLSMLTIEFISGLKKALKEDGFIVLNTFTNNKYKEQEIKLLKEIFGTFYAITNDSNMVIFASNGVFPNINEIEKSSVFWRFRLSEIGINQYRIIELFKGMKKYTP